MPAHAMWKGSLSFSLVNIPVQLWAGSQEQGLSLHLLHKADKSPIRFARVCKKDGHEVPWKDIVKGYEVAEDDYVIIDQKELEKADARKTKAIEILSFTDGDKIEDYYFEKPYYLEPLKGGEKSYAMLREALSETKKVGVCKIVFTNREHLAEVKAEGNALMLNTLRFETELRRPDLSLPGPYKGRKDELALAKQLISKLTKPFDPAKYKDTYKKELEAYIKRKAKGRPLPKLEEKEPEPTKVPDLMDALRRSLKGGHGEQATVH
jgi:DNA end-binding protein Ku